MKIHYALGADWRSGKAGPRTFGREVPGSSLSRVAVRRGLEQVNRPTLYPTQNPYFEHIYSPWPKVIYIEKLTLAFLKNY